MVEPRRIAVLSGSRSDYTLLHWTMHRIHHDPGLELVLIVTGSHLSPEFGLTVADIEAAGFPIAARVEALLSSDTAEATATSIGLGTIKTAQALAGLKPDILLVLGDRTEILAAVAAALPLRIPVAHIHGGESTEGAIDESIRHAVTKLSHLHFASTEFYAQRLLQMGEEPWRVHVCGAPGLEHQHRIRLADREELEAELGLDLARPTLVVTHHPVTLSPDGGAPEVTEVLTAVEQSGLPAVITYPNADTGGRAIIQQVKSFVERYPQARVKVNLGPRRYMALLRHAAALVGNSSSGIIEAASFGLPVVNVGDRQRGRVRGANVIDVPPQKDAIFRGIQRALDPGFRRMAAECSNPYDLGNASEVIVPVLKEIELGDRLLMKSFVDYPSTLEALHAGERT